MMRNTYSHFSSLFGKPMPTRKPSFPIKKDKTVDFPKGNQTALSF